MLVYELAPAHYSTVYPLFADVWRDQAMVDGVFEGIHTAKIFVDDLERPTASLMATDKREYFVVGNPDAPDLLQFLRDTPSESGAFDFDYFAFFVPDVAWEQPLRATGIRHFHPSRCFRHVAPDFPPLSHFQQKAAPNAQLHWVDEAFLAHIDTGDIHDLGAGLVYGRKNTRADFERVSRETFLWVVTMNGEVASIAHANAVSKRYAMLFIDTKEPYWRQGLGNLACAGFVQHCRQMGKIALWGCLTENIKSGNMALGLGFEEGQPCLESDWQPYGDYFKPSEGLWTATPSGANVVWTKNERASA